MWEVDPESKSKLHTLQSLPANKLCIDCAAPSPQWASPKFGTFICLSCAGLHRSLGVHISFVRSIAMDSFKAAEVSRMEKGGNERWRREWEGGSGQKWSFPGRGADEPAKKKVEAVYGGDIGGEYKERLSCDVEGREFTGYTPPPVKRKDTATSTTPTAGGGGGRTASPMKGMGSRSQKEMNESFFAKKGGENASRPDGVKPSEGGKYAGFGGGYTPDPPRRTGGEGGEGGAPPRLDEFQQDPLGALGKGLGWFGGVVGKAGKSVNDGWIQPTAQKIAEADIATQARQAAGTAGKTIQTGAKGAADRFNNFIENEGAGTAGGSGSGGGARSGGGGGGGKPERQDFWDSFGDAGKAGGGGGSIGTSAVKKGGKDEGGWGNDW